MMTAKITVAVSTVQSSACGWLWNHLLKLMDVPEILSFQMKQVITKKIFSKKKVRQSCDCMFLFSHFILNL